MEKFIDKLSSYNLLNNMLPGSVFCYLFNKIVNINLLQDNIIENLFLYYFVGMIISRIGSVIVEPICMKIRFVVFAPYKDYVKASLGDDKINVLSETNNAYRAMLSMCLILLITKVYFITIFKIDWLAKNTNFIVVICLMFLFAFSYKKQTNYVRKRVKQTQDDPTPDLIDTRNGWYNKTSGGNNNVCKTL